jgi:hypothetical protein
MEIIFILNIILYLVILVLSLIIFNISKAGFLGLRAEIFCKTNTIIEKNYISIYSIQDYYIFSKIIICICLIIKFKF